MSDLEGAQRSARPTPKAEGGGVGRGAQEQAVAVTEQRSAQGFRGFHGWSGSQAAWGSSRAGSAGNDIAARGANLLLLLLIRVILAIRGHIHCMKRLRVEAHAAPFRFCVCLRGLRAPSVEPPRRKGTQSCGISSQPISVPDFRPPRSTSTLRRAFTKPPSGPRDSKRAGPDPEAVRPLSRF
jgi:hypothetical protein